ncbi:MAG: hypothetical protein J6X44_10400 [Thermoguttaceae bacterium]|nr:hypothetical protein [Thermoguttaceae bacterium]
MKKQTTALGLLLAFLASALVSCEAFRPQPSTAPIPNSERKTLERATLPPDSVVFDVLLTRIPYQERDLARDFWNDVDELEVEATTRKRLNEQGFRAGLVGASPPDSLSKLLTLKGRELRETIEEEVDYSKPESTNEPITSSKPVTLRQGMKSMIETRSDVYASIPILENENGALIGKIYSDARTTLSVSIEQNLDGSVRFDLSPLLKYGAPQPITRYQHGQLIRTQEQPTKSFEQLKFSVSLRPGQFLVLGATDAKTNALGKYFFTDGGEDFDQKILVLRLLVTQHDGQFDRFPDFKELALRAYERDEDLGESAAFDSNSSPGQDGLGFGDYVLETEAENPDDSVDEESEPVDVPLFQNDSNEGE